MPSRVSRQPIYISITAEGKRDQLSGKYNYHCFKNGAATFIRDGGKIEGLEIYHPYYMMYKQKWLITASEDYENNDAKGWLLLDTKGLSEFLLVEHLNYQYL